jgi:hypothetical protein
VPIKKGRVRKFLERSLIALVIFFGIAAVYIEVSLNYYDNLAVGYSFDEKVATQKAVKKIEEKCGRSWKFEGSVSNGYSVIIAYKCLIKDETSNAHPKS